MTSDIDAATQAWLDQEDRRTAEIIRRHGTFIQFVGGDQRARHTSFAYTVGLFGLGHPELLVFGVDPTSAANILNDVSARIRDGSDLVPGEILTFADRPHRVLIEAVPNPGEIAFTANRFYQRPDEYSVPVYQLTIDDEGGRFPGEPGYSRPAWLQPRPGEFRA
ncbi:hypothetical protein GCM10022240_22890 [Microbacterium kribbense]|uniref:DUF4262 domain-containing protein n=1 Tax=Microbacterium kribbense TaxID=433645 RepID=A0ABP7GMF9_9MICO